MTNTKTITTKKTNRYVGALVALAVLAMVAVVLAARPSYASTTTFTVTSATDLADVNPGDGVCDATASIEDTCTLRAAIEQANATSGADVIDFDIIGGGVQTITPSSALPDITDQVTIDGYTQPGASPNTKTVGDDAALKITLDGTNLPNSSGLEISSSSGSVIRGLVINRFHNGVFIHGTSVGNRIEGNYIGTNPTGTIDHGNNFNGVDIAGGPSETVVGGSTPDKRNVISGNDGTGVFIDASNANLIKGNYVGTDKSGTKDLGNTSSGVAIEDASGTTVGGKTAVSGNVISGNDNGGLGILSSQGTKVLGNRIGTTASGTGALGNDLRGVAVYADSSGNLVGDGTSAGSNTIAFNGQDGVEVTDNSTGNEVSRNSIFSNAGLGIDLVGPGEGSFTNVPTPNDPGDADFGPNNLQNKPVLSSAKTVSGKTTIKGKLSSNTDETYIIEFYSNPTDTNEGKKFIDEKTVTTSVDGLRTFTLATSVSVGQTITATATRESTKDSTHDTSEFSAPRTVVSS